MYEVFLGGYSTLNNDYVTFYIRHVTCKYKKKNRFHSTFECLKKPPHASVKTFLRLYGSFCEIYTFQLGVFSIHNFYLHNLKGNGNAPSVNQERCVDLNL